MAFFSPQRVKRKGDPYKQSGGSCPGLASGQKLVVGQFQFLKAKRRT